MFKNLKEQLQNELKRMQAELVAAIKTIVGEDENVVASMNQDLSRIDVKMTKKDVSETLEKETRYVFSRIEQGDGPDNIKVARLFSSTSKNLILDKGEVIGSFVSDTPVDLIAIQSIFAKIEHFKQKEEGEVEAAPPQEQ